MIKSIIKPTVILSLICLAVAAALTGTHFLTADAIAEAQKKAVNDALLRVVPNADKFENFNDGYMAFDASGNMIGFAVIKSSKGYGGDVNTAVGFNEDGVIIGISVSAPNETPGLGANVQNGSFTNQFVGKNVFTQFSINSNIDRVTSATYSSLAVTNGVNEAITWFLDYCAVQE